MHLCCPVCGKESCLKCGKAWHGDMNCKEAEIEFTVGENDIKFQKYLKKQPFKRCPHCGIWVERTRVRHLTYTRDAVILIVSVARISATTVWEIILSIGARLRSMTSNRPSSENNRSSTTPSLRNL